MDHFIESYFISIVGSRVIILEVVVLELL